MQHTYKIFKLIEMIKTTSMETVGTGVLDRNKERYLRSKDKAKKNIWCIKTYTIAYVAYFLQSIM